MAPRTNLSLIQKMDIIKAQMNQKLPVRELAKRFNIGKTQAAEILKKQDTILAKVASGVNVNQQRSSLSPHGSQVDRLCYEWFTKARSRNIPVSGQIVKAKAREIAEKVGYTGFQGSDGWLQKWRIRHNIAFKSLVGEESDEDVNLFKVKLPIMTRKEESDSINSYDEALKQIARLKKFAKDDFKSFQMLNHLHNRFLELKLKSQEI